MTIESAKWIPWLPAAAALLCTACCAKRSLRVLAAPICILALVGSFLIAFLTRNQLPENGHQVLTLFDWISVSDLQFGDFKAAVGYYVDPLTTVMLLTVTGIGSLVAIYAAGYMAGDRGYARFFAAVSLFIFTMTTLVMADNLILLYLGWEGVGLCSYLLIGFYYHKPSAVAAAKKAFIVNRIGDLGFALGIMLTYHHFHTVEFAPLLKQLGQIHAHGLTVEWPVKVIPFLLMLGAFGKSAQLPLYMWLPDAMEGPTPVSALIHAATMVTAGVYLIARLFPLFQYSPYALPTVAFVGGLTALFAATIALCQYDIKRVFAYSTISQLGYMFMAVGAGSTIGAMFHLFTHAFFKALLFLTAGSVMHSLAGQLDLRKMSGLRAKMPVTCGLMLIGCLTLAGFPFFSGFYSKDMILADTLAKGLAEHSNLYTLLAVMGIVTAALTSYYTFRLWFRVFTGPTEYEMGQDPGSHGPHDAHHTAPTHTDLHHEPHEVNWIMNGPLVVLAIGAIVTGFACQGWIQEMVAGSSARASLHTIPPSQGHAGDYHGLTLFGIDLHLAMQLLSGSIAIAGIAVAWYFHHHDRPAADRLAKQWSGLVRLLANKYYVDELCDAVFVKPLNFLGQLFYVVDRLIIDGLVTAVGWLPRLLGLSAQPLQRGILQTYGLGMAIGASVFLLLILAIFR